MYIDISEQLSQALANISQGVCHPLKIRVEKILSVPVPLMKLYTVVNLIRFYKNSINQVSHIRIRKYLINKTVLYYRLLKVDYWI